MRIECSNEIDLVRQTLNGETLAFDRLVKLHRTTIYALVLSYIKDPADAEDLTQRVFIRAYERLATLRELDRFRPWLLQIAHNTCKDWLRRRSGLTTRFEATNDTDFAEVAPSPEDIALKAEIETVVRQAISALRETDRRLMEARYIEGASYDQLQVESGLSYAAIANRLKRAKREIRCRIEKLLGCVAVLPGRTFILGGIEAVKLSVKAKLATVGVAAVIGIGGGGVVYHQAFESNSVEVNEQAVSVANAVTENSSTKVVDQTDTTSDNNSSMNGASIPTAGEANHFEIATDDRGVKPAKTVEIADIREAVRNLLEDRLSEETLEMKVEEVEEVVQKAVQAVIETLEHRGDSGEDIITQVIKNKDELMFMGEHDGIKTSIRIEMELRDPTHSVLTPSDPSVESTATLSEMSESTAQFPDEDWAEVEKLLSEFSDEDWAELARLLRDSAVEETPQRNGQTPLNPKPQRRMEETIEEPPVDPSVRQEIQHRQRRPLENDTDALPPKTDRNMGR
ncbi:hypothetical protein C6502_01075 [Candidatus Poribacteria bacterium]|nr:MAG: hypothetical protein C6502_01075 [Candidatus Poribacteria bacterium]